MIKLAQPWHAHASPTIGRCINGGLAWLEGRVQSLQDPGRASRSTPSAGQGKRRSGLIELPVLP